VRRRGAFAVGSALVAVGLVWFVLARDPIWTVTAVGIAGIGGSTLLNAAVPVLTDHHRGGGAAALSEGNAMAAVVGLVAPLAVGASVGLGWTWRPTTALMLPLLLLVVMAVRRVPGDTPALDTPAARRLTRAEARRSDGMSAVTWTYLIMVVACVGVEFCCTAWSADLLRTRTTLSPAAASTGVTAVVTGMAIGRLTLGRLALTVGPRRLMALALVITLAGWVVVWTTTSAPVALTGLLITGLGIAGHYPLGASLLLASTPGQADRTTGRMSLGISVAAGGGPFALGAVADVTSTHTAFVAVPMLLAVGAAALATALKATATS
jgi:fucose permease